MCMCIHARTRVYAHIPRPTKLILKPGCVSPPLSRIGKRSEAPQTFPDITPAPVQVASTYSRWGGKYLPLNGVAMEKRARSGKGAFEAPR